MRIAARQARPVAPKERLAARKVGSVRQIQAAAQKALSAALPTAVRQGQPAVTRMAPAAKQTRIAAAVTPVAQQNPQPANNGE